MRSFLSKGIIAFAGIVVAPMAPCGVSKSGQSDVIRHDPRFLRLVEFFHARKSPLVAHAWDFVKAADDNSLDWRLLPSISVIESGGGKNARNNNVLGWGSTASGFHSVSEGIHAVAKRLSCSKLYRGKSLEGKLRTYNTNAEYPSRVIQVMMAIGPMRPRLAVTAD